MSNQRKSTSRRVSHSNFTEDFLCEDESVNSNSHPEPDDDDDKGVQAHSTKKKNLKSRSKPFVLPQHIKVLPSSSRGENKNRRGTTVSNSNPVFQCVCGSKFRSKSSIWAHKDCSSDKPKPFVCGVAWCGKGFFRKDHLEGHSRTHTGERPFKCQDCTQSFAMKKELRRHEKVHAKTFVCSKCPKRYGTQDELNQHLGGYCHAREKIKAREPAVVPEHISVLDPSTLSKIGKRFRCCCGSEFNSRRTISAHRHCPGAKPKLHICSFTGCGKTFEKKADLEVHFKTHSGERPFECTQCPQKFVRRYHLKRHILGVHSKHNHIVVIHKVKQTLAKRRIRAAVSAVKEVQTTLHGKCETVTDARSSNSTQLKIFTSDADFAETVGRDASEGMNEIAVPKDCESFKPEVPNISTINEVLFTLFTFTDFKTLKSCRLVSKLWNNESRTRWRQDARIVLKGGNGNESSLVEYLTASNIPGDPFTLMSTPYKNYRIDGCDLKLQEGDGQSEFFSKFGPIIKDLQIRNSSFETKADFEAIVLKLTPKLEVLTLAENKYFGNPDDEPVVATSVTQPNLKELNLKLVEFDSDELVACKGRTDRGDGNVNLNLPYPSWADLLECFPNMQKTRLENVICSGARLRRHDLQSLFGAIAKLKREGRSCPPLEHLDILNALQPALQHPPMPIFRKLRKLRLPLVSLSMDIGVDTEQTVFQTMLERLAPTLRVLKVFRAPYASPFSNIQINVRMEKLEEVTLIGPIFHDLNFLEFMPRLKMLRRRDKNKILSPLSKQLLSPAQQPLTSVSLVKGTDFENLHHLIIPSLVEFIDGDELCSSDDVSYLARMMPNLETLKIGLNIYGFKTVSKNWKRLKSLDVDPYKVLNMKELVLHRRRLNDVTSCEDWDFSSIISMLDRIQLTVNGMDGEEAINLLTRSISRMQLDLQIETSSDDE